MGRGPTWSGRRGMTTSNSGSGAGASGITGNVAGTAAGGTGAVDFIVFFTFAFAFAETEDLVTFPLEATDFAPDAAVMVTGAGNTGGGGGGGVCVHETNKHPAVMDNMKMLFI